MHAGARAIIRNLFYSHGWCAFARTSSCVAGDAMSSPSAALRFLLPICMLTVPRAFQWGCAL